MGPLDEFTLALREAMKGLIPVQTIWAIVDDVDEYTMTVLDMAESDIKYYQVLLGLNGMMIWPEKGSRVLIGVIENNDKAYFLIHADKWKSCELNGDKYGGLTIADKVTERLNAIEQKFNSYMDFEDGLPLPVNGAVSGPPVPGARTSFKLNSTQSENLQNTVVKHG